MSTGTKIPHAQAIEAAKRFRGLIIESCIDHCCGGSLRRECPEVGDIEHVVISRSSRYTPAGSMFEEEGPDILRRLDELVAQGVIDKQVKSDGRTRWGERYRACVHEGVVHEVFIADNTCCECGVSLRSSHGTQPQSTESHSIPQKVRQLRQEVRGQEPEDMQQVLLRGAPVQRGEAKDRTALSEGDMRRMPEGVPREELSRRRIPRGQEDMQQEVSSGDTGRTCEEEGGVCGEEAKGTSERVCRGLQPQALSEKEGVPCHGAPRGDGGALGEGAGIVGDRASPERRETRQPNRKLGDRHEEQASGRSGVPALPSEILHRVDACPRCGGRGWYSWNWGAILAIRTGPAEFSEAMVTRIAARGVLHMRGGFLVYQKTGDRYPCADEETFFRAAGLPYTAPEFRTAPDRATGGA